MQLVQQQAVTLVSRTVRLPLSEIAVAQTVGGALRTARVIIKERQDHLSCFANRRTVARGGQHSSKGEGGHASLAFRATWATGSAGTKRSCGERL